MRNRDLFNFTTLCLLLIIVVHIFLLSKLIFFPYPELFIYSYLTKQGLIPYKQIFDQHFPGIMFFPVNLATLGIDTPQETRILHLGIVVLTQILLFLVGRKLFKSNLLSLTSNFLYLIWQPFYEGYVLWIDTMVVPILLLAFYFILDTKKHSMLYAGFFLGASLLFKQVVVPLIILVSGLLVFRNSVRRGLAESRALLEFLSGLAIPVFSLVFWVITFGIWREFIYWTITFNLSTFAQMGRKYPDLVEFIKLLPLFGTASFSWFYLFMKKKSEEILLLGLFLFGSLFFTYARFDFVHLQPAIPFAVLLVVYGFKLLSKKIIFLFSTLYLILILYLFVPFYKSVLNNKVYFFGEIEASLSQKVLEYSTKGDTVFTMGTTPHLYFLTQTLPPGRVFVFPFPWFMKVSEEKILNGIIIDPPKVIVRDKNAQVQGMNLVEYMPNINEYVERYYKTVDYINGTEIMIKSK